MERPEWLLVAGRLIKNSFPLDRLRFWNSALLVPAIAGGFLLEWKMRIFGIRKSFIEKIFHLLTGSLGILAAFWLIPRGFDMAKPGIIGTLLGFAMLIMAQKYEIVVLSAGNVQPYIGAAQSGALKLYLQYCAAAGRWCLIYIIFSAFCIMSAVKNPCWAFGYGFTCGTALGAYVRIWRLYGLLCDMRLKGMAG